LGCLPSATSASPLHQHQQLLHQHTTITEPKDNSPFILTHHPSATNQSIEMEDPLSPVEIPRLSGLVVVLCCAAASTVPVVVFCVGVWWRVCILDLISSNLLD